MNNLSISAQEWQRVGTLFDRLSTLPPEQRALDTLDEPPALRSLLERMLHAHDTNDVDALEATFGDAVESLLELDAEPDEPESYAGRSFGPWRAITEIGRGGMAVVLRGERADGRFEKVVAIKLLPRAGTAAERDRLLAEMRILARLEHPHIARLVDGGIEDDGTPYLVMEYVPGEPITQYCRKRSLPRAERVRLFRQVVDAVASAHRQLIVHCDLKPANILVSEVGQAKLVDFGIARLIDSNPSVAGLFCSPGYCAPEQRKGATSNTAQDIFSLGAILYELLGQRRLRDARATNHLLFGKDTPPVEFEPPTRPRDRDLDAICANCLATDASARYASANELRKDLDCWLEHRPVAARQGHWPYRIARWLRRHRWSAAAGLLAGTALLTGSVVIFFQQQTARLEAERVTAVTDFITDVFDASNPFITDQADPPASQLLGIAADQAIERLYNHPGLLARVLRSIARTQLERGLVEQADRSIRTALALFENGHAHDPLTRAALLRQYAMTAYEAGDFPLSVQRARAALAWMDQAGLHEHPDFLRTQARLADLLYARGQFDAAKELAVSALRTAGTSDTSDTGYARSSLMLTLGRVALETGELKSGIDWLEQSLAVSEGESASATRRATIHNSLGIGWYRLGNSDRARSHLRQALDIQHDSLGEGHATTLATRGNLAYITMLSGDTGTARDELAQVLELQLERFGREPHWETALTRGYLALAHYLHGEPDLAQSFAHEAWRDAGELDASARDDMHWIAGLDGLIRLQTGHDGAAALLAEAAGDCNLDTLDGELPIKRSICLAHAWLSIDEETCPMPGGALPRSVSKLDGRWSSVYWALRAKCAADDAARREAFAALEEIQPEDRQPFIAPWLAQQQP